MSSNKDFILGNDGAMLIANGDFVVDYSDGQEGQLLLLSEPGSWRQNPLAGCGVRRMINMKLSPLDIISKKKDITIQFKNDGKVVNSISVAPSGLVQIDYE